MVLGVALPVIHVNLRQTGDEEFQFLFVEDCDELSGNDIVETYASLGTFS